MASRTYTGIDLSNYFFIPTLTQADGGTATANNAGQGSAVITGNGSQTRVPPGPGLSANQGVKGSAIVSLGGDFNFNAFPQIPDNAIITSVQFGFNGTITGSGVNTSDGVGSGSQTTSINGAIDPSFGGAPTLSAGASSTVDNGNSTPVSMSASVAQSSLTTDNFGGVPITKAQLISAFTALSFSVSGGGQAGATGASAGVYGIVSFTASISLSNFVFIVNYDLPNLTMTLNPANGNVEPGKSIIVTSNSNLKDFDFAIVKDNSIIPINIKHNNDGTATLEVPYPSTTDCSNCLATCTDCTACFDVCTADLDSQACKDCMDKCLKCLENCLKDVLDAEACNESTRTTPSQINIIIICSNPTLFDGVIPLGNFTIIVARGSGLYKFVDGKTNDTVYQAARDGTTLNIKIPNPFGKIGFFRS